MTSKHRAIAAIALALVACGKSSKKDPGPASGSQGGTATASGGGPTKKDPIKAPPRGPERTVYSLTDNRLAGHLLRGGGLVLPGGSVGFSKYTRFGNLEKLKTRTWEPRQQEGDIKAAK